MDERIVIGRFSTPVLCVACTKPKDVCRKCFEEKLETGEIYEVKG